MGLPDDLNAVVLQPGCVSLHGLAANALHLGAYANMDHLYAGGNQPFQFLRHPRIFFGCLPAVTAAQERPQVHVFPGILRESASAFPQRIQAGNTGADLVCLQAVQNCNRRCA